MTTTLPSLGFIGLGIMGAPMCANLLRAGYRVHAYSRSGVPDALAQAGAIPSASALDVTRKADVIFLMLPDTPHVEEVLFGERGVGEGLMQATGAALAHSPAPLQSPKVIVDMSSISPLATKDFASKIKALGGDYLDAPVSGGEVGAKAGSLSIMVGGDEAVFERVLPLFQLMGKNITLVGPVGAGQTAKVANQIIVALNIEAVAEALVFAAKAGADPAKVRQALMGGFASSKILEVHGERMIRRTFNPGFRIGLHQKDLSLALSAAQTLGVALPNTATAQQLFNQCVAHGGQAWDHAALVRALEMQANVTVGSDAGAESA